MEPFDLISLQLPRQPSVVAQSGVAESGMIPTNPSSLTLALIGFGTMALLGFGRRNLSRGATAPSRVLKEQKRTTERQAA